MKSPLKFTKSIVRIATVLLIFSAFESTAQTCASSSRNSFEWPGHNNWFLGAWSPTDGSGHILNQRTGILTKVTQPDFSTLERFTTSITAYEGVSAASDDNGSLVFFTNGRKAWKADGTLITDSILAGNECGAVLDKSSTAHGVMIVKHPLQPLYYYVVTIDDIVNQTCGINGLSVAIIDSSGNLVNKSLPMDSFTGEGREKYRTTEAIAATMHGNGVDVWLTVHPIDSDFYLNYLLTVDGFKSAPVVSNGMANNTALNMGNGALAYSWDGKKFAAVHNVHLGNINNAPDYGYNGVNLYDFDNLTGLISNRKAVFNNQWGGYSMYNVIFSADNSKLHYSGAGITGKIDVNAGSVSDIRATTTPSPFLVGNYIAGAMTYDGNIVNRDGVNAQHTELGGSNQISLGDMFIPPSDEPSITEIGALCDTGSVVDLQTNWLCSGINSELVSSTSDHDGGYFGQGIVSSDSGRTNGFFDPKLAGIGTHEIIFMYGAVDDTIHIEVVQCLITGINNMKDDNIQIFPNPSTNNFEIQGVWESMQIKTMDGSVVLTQANLANNSRVTVNHNLAAGTYLVELQNENGTTNFVKLIVQ